MSLENTILKAWEDRNNINKNSEKQLFLQLMKLWKNWTRVILESVRKKIMSGILING